MVLLISKFNIVLLAVNFNKTMRFFSSAFYLFLVCVIPLQSQDSNAIDTVRLNDLYAFSQKTYTDEVLIFHKNMIVGHWKNPDCDSTLFNTASMVKSWTGIVIGILIDQGYLSSEEDLVCKYIPEWTDGCKHQVTIKHLLTMSAGLNQRRGAAGVLDEKDINTYVTHLELDTMPGIRFSYSNESVQLLGILIENITGKTANAYFREVLFSPLGMHSTSLTKDSVGNDIVFGGALTTLPDASKVGLLMLNKGLLNGHPVVSSAWVEKSISPSDKASYYGYLWWLDNNSEHKNFAATGDFGQLTMVFPELDLVFMRQQSCNKDISGNMTWMGPNYIKQIAALIK